MITEDEYEEMEEQVPTIAQAKIIRKAIGQAEIWRLREKMYDEECQKVEQELQFIRGYLRNLEIHKAEEVGAVFTESQFGSVAVKINGKWMIPYKETLDDEDYKYREVEQ